MPNKMLIDATHPEETRVVVVRGNRVEEFDFETAQRKQLRGNIYLAKVTRVEPSLQAAFVEYGGNRHGFLAFSEIHPDYYRIPVADRERLLRDAAADDDDDVEAAGGQGQGRGRQPRRAEPDAQPDSPSPTEIAVGIDRDHDHAGADGDWPAQQQSSDDQPAYEQPDDHVDPVTAIHDEHEAGAVGRGRGRSVAGRLAPGNDRSGADAVGNAALRVARRTGRGAGDQW